MASLRDIRRKIKSIKNTQQITKAMKMACPPKLQRRWMAALILVSSAAWGCRCLPPGSPTAELDQSAAVFSGRVVSIKKAPKMTERVTFKVLKAWKGPRKKQLIITTSTDPEECGFEFKRGQKYLVYATGDSSQLSTSLCSRTGPLDIAGNDIKEFP